MQIDVKAAADMLKGEDNIVILSHQKPDGDTLGSAFALLYALEDMGKTARVECADGYPSRYDFIYGDYTPKDFKFEFVVTTDIAGPQLLGSLREKYKDIVDLCIDHHKSNSLVAKFTLCDHHLPATAQLVFYLIEELGVTVTKRIANAIFTGLSTDTGCFKYDNVTAQTHRVAAQMIDCGAEHGLINRLMFDNTTKGRLEVDRHVYDSLEFYFEDQCAVVSIREGIPEQYGVTEEELDGVSSFPRKIKGVKAGVTIRERQKGLFRISIRSGDGVDASKICSQFGGGGHKNAGGCTLVGSYEDAKSRILGAIEIELERLNK